MTYTFQPAVLLFPDAVSEIVVYLRGKLPAGTIVGMDMSEWDKTKTSVQVSRIGGVAEGVHDKPQIQVDVRSIKWDDCTDMAALVRKWMSNMPFEIDHVKAVREANGFRNLPQTGESIARVTGDFTVTLAGSP